MRKIDLLNELFNLGGSGGIVQKVRVNITVENDTYTADKTYSEMVDLITREMEIYLVFQDKIYKLSRVDIEDSDYILVFDNTYTDNDGAHLSSFFITPDEIFRVSRQFEIDNSVSAGSENAVQNGVIKSYIDNAVNNALYVDSEELL